MLYSVCRSHTAPYVGTCRVLGQLQAASAALVCLHSGTVFLARYRPATCCPYIIVPDWSFGHRTEYVLQGDAILNPLLQYIQLRSHGAAGVYLSLYHRMAE
jgi:hypothetical protein